MLRRVVLIVAVLSCGARVPTAMPYGGTFTLQEEDDVLALNDRSDRGYTNGTRLMWTWSPAAASRWGRLAGMLCRGESAATCERLLTAGIGQSMYTPEYLRSPTAIRGDRPYGGWLYGLIMTEAVREQTADHLELYLGVVGPDSRADDVQIFWHKHVTPSSPDPLGWETQIGQWAGVLANYQRRFKLAELRDRRDSPYFDITPTLGVTLGNVLDYASAGITLRLGRNLPPRFFQPIPSVASLDVASSFQAGQDEPAYDWYFFVTAEPRYVARNIFIDTQDEDYGIERRSLVRDRRVGASVRLRRFRVEYTHTLRTAEFDPDPRSHPYGTIRVVIGARP